MQEDSILRINDLQISYREQSAVRGASFDLPRGSSTALIGANGAGKTSMLMAIARALPGTAKCSGDMAFRPLMPDSRIAIVPEHDKIFSLLSVEENLQLVARRNRRGKVAIDDVYGWFPRLADRRRSLAGDLSGGEQQMVALSLGLLCSPELLLLDEPTLGLAVPVTEALCEKLAVLRRELDMTILLSEADGKWVAELAERAIVVDRGIVVARIDSDLVAHQRQIHELTLGLSADGGSD